MYFVTAAACSVGLGVSAWAMAGKVVSFHESSKREVYVFDRLNSRSFEYAGKKVVFEDDRRDQANQVLNVTYGEETLKLHVSVPGNAKLPDLEPHADWMRVMRFALRSGRTMDEFKRDLGTSALPDRLAIVTRTPRPGTDPQTWGEVWMKDWMFDFYEFKPAGGFTHERLRFPTNRVGEALKEGELKENTWQFQAALQLMPPAARERLANKTTNDAMSRLGWTLPAAAIFGVGLTLSLGFGAFKRRP
ncbi:MAG: hypothetical protein JSR77_06335 [Planctomycetes bacterium]|nr:hypothetical protein [Planctomycetota bacterium]